MVEKLSGVYPSWYFRE